MQSLLHSTIKNKSPSKNKSNNAVNSRKVLSQLKFEMLNLEDENRTLRQILTASSDPILITSKDVQITYVNPAWEKLTGYTADEVLGQNPKILQSGKTPKHIYKKMWKSLFQGKAFISREVIDKRKNGSEYQIHSSIFPVRNDGDTQYYVQIQHDITGIKRMEALHKEFLSSAAHELKTPITVLKLLAQSHLYKARKLGIDSIKASELELVDRELDRVSRLINDMLDSTRFETGKMFMQYEEIDLSELIIKIVKKISIYAKSHNIIIEKIFKNKFVIADRERIEQVLVNLLSNAVKYSPDGEIITVSVVLKDKNIIVSVRDRGIGIPKSRQKLIFDRYYQVKSKSNIGFGLGLYISKEIIKRHKGKLWVESNVGKGSIFSFSLPTVEDEKISDKKCSSQFISKQAGIIALHDLQGSI